MGQKLKHSENGSLLGPIERGKLKKKKKELRSFMENRLPHVQQANAPEPKLKSYLPMHLQLG